MTLISALPPKADISRMQRADSRIRKMFDEVYTDAI
jgi:hypothetical protein